MMCEGFNMKIDTKSLTCRYVLKLIEHGFFDEEVFDMFSPREIQQLSYTTKKNAPLDIDELYDLLSDLSCIENYPRFGLNCSYFLRSIGLNKKIKRLFELTIMSSIKPRFFEFIEDFIVKSSYSYHEVLAALCDLDEADLHECIDELNSLGLGNSDDLDYELPAIPLGLASYLLTSDNYDSKKAISLFLNSMEPASYRLSNFEHIETEHLKKLLSGWKASNGTPVNILLHGAVGTGKTELAKALCESLNLVLMGVSSSCSTNDKARPKFLANKSSPSTRIQNLLIGRKLMGNRRDGVLLVDECEDLFEVDIMGFTESKELLNSLIDNSNSATIWITNHVETLPLSCIRRFDYVLEVPGMSADKRTKHVSESFSPLSVSKDFLARAISNKHLSLANISKAAHGAKLCNYSKNKAEEFISAYFDGVLSASGIDTNELRYKPELKFEHANINLKGSFSTMNDIVNAIESHHGARTLLFGPAGTGKTAFVNHVCEEAGFDLISVQASDILSKWVGESEQNIKELFVKATEQEAAIFIDEADSLFASREGAKSNWEIQSVNQLLCNLDMFEFPFFAATNLKDKLDKALLRRCDFKLELDYLTEQQVKQMLLKLTGEKSLPPSSTKMLTELNRLTPGDFSVIARKMRFSKKSLSIANVLECLYEEQKVKGLLPRRIGF